MRQFFFVVTVIFLSCFSTLSLKQTVFAAKDTVEVCQEPEHVREVEKEYEAQVRRLLEERLFANSGVMMTKVIYGDGYVEYTVQIHNDRIDRLPACEQESLIRQLELLEFPLPDSTVCHEFIE